MPTAQSIRAPDAPQNYSAVVANFRRAYEAKFDTNQPCQLTDHEVLLCWEEGWSAAYGEDEDDVTLEMMREMVLEKLLEDTGP